jgi:hypothetical protein
LFTFEQFCPHTWMRAPRNQRLRLSERHLQALDFGAQPAIAETRGFEGDGEIALAARHVGGNG